VRQLKQLRPALTIKTKAAAINTTTLPSPSHTVITLFTFTDNIRQTSNMFKYLLAALLELSMFMLAEAAPVSAQSAKPWQAGTGGGIVGFIVLVLDIIAWSMSLPCLACSSPVEKLLSRDSR